MGGPDLFAVHFNARVRAMRSELFPRARIEDILDQQDLAVTIEFLLNSPYQKEMAEALAEHQGADAVEEAVTRNLSKNFRKLMYRGKGRYRELTLRFLLRWDLTAVKSLLRARHCGLHGQEAMPALVPGPTLSVALLRNLATAESMEALVSGLMSWNAGLCGCLIKAVEQYRAEHSMAIIEEALDRRYFVTNSRELKDAPDEDSRLLRCLLQMEIDRINLRVLFKLMDAKVSRQSMESYLLPEGSLSQRVLSRMIASQSVVEVMELLGNTIYRELVEQLYHFLQTRRFAPLERYFELTLMQQLRRMARNKPFSIAVPMDYTWQKSNEVTNLRLIARGEARHLARGRVREELLYV